MMLLLFLGAWGKMTHKNKPEAKISWHFPLKIKSLLRSGNEKVRGRLVKLLVLGTSNMQEVSPTTLHLQENDIPLLAAAK